MMSLCVHLALLLSLAVYWIGGDGNRQGGIEVLGQTSQEYDWEGLETVEILSESVVTELELAQEETRDVEESQAKALQEVAEPPQVSEVGLRDLEQGDLERTDVGESAMARGVAEAVSASGRSVADQGESQLPSEGTGAYFFGTYASGQRFVFVIDSSQSMLEGGRWSAMRRELIRALSTLSPDQEFFVISFDSTAKPMFGQFPPNSKFLHPNAGNIDRVNRWVGTISHGGSTLPASSIGIALRMEPDAIFLLSDGEIQDTTLQELRLHNRRKNSKGSFEAIIPIHTVSLFSMAGFRTLQAIADENDGVFTPVR
jgi:hypothetical protein